MQRLLFVDAPAVTGNALITLALQRYINSKGLKVLTVASSAVSSKLVDDGRALHSALKIPIAIQYESTSHALSM